MSIYEDIINGTYGSNKKKKTIYESILDGTYGKPNKDDKELKTIGSKIENYTDIKKSLLKDVGSSIKEENQKQKEKQDIINQQIAKQTNEINNNFSQQNQQTVTNIENSQPYNYRNIMNNNKTSSLKENPLQLVNLNEINNAKKLKKGDIFKLTNGAKDDRSERRKVLDNVIAPIENLGIGIESTLSGIGKYEDASFKQLSKLTAKALLGNFIKDNEAKEKAGDVIGDLAYENIGRKLITNKSSKEFNEEVQKEQQWRENTISENINKTTNPLAKKAAEIAPSIGNNLLPMAVTAINPAVGTTLFMTSAAGGYLEDAKKRGMNDNEAFGYATVMGLAEGGSESLISGKMLSNAKKLITGKNLSEELLNSYGLNLTENFLQEALMEPMQEATAEVIGGKETANWDNVYGRMLESGIDGIVSAIILSGASVGIESAVIVSNKLENKQKISLNEIKKAIQDVQKSNIDTQEVVRGSIEAIYEKNTFSIENNEKPVYNRLNERESDLNEQQYEPERTIDQSGVVRNVGEIKQDEQRRSSFIPNDTEGKIDGSRVRQNNFSQEQQSIVDAYEDKEKISKTIEYAKKNPMQIPTKDILEVQNKAKELGIPVNIYKGEEGNTHIGLTDGKEIYLDANSKNSSKEDGSLMDRFSHEILHYIKRNNNTQFASTIDELKDKIYRDNKESIITMVEKKGYDSNKLSDNVFSYLAEEVLADYSAKHIANYDIDYSISEDITYVLNQTLDDAIVELKNKQKNNNEFIKWLDEKKIDYNTDEKGNIEYIEDKKAINEYYKEKSLENSKEDNNNEQAINEDYNVLNDIYEKQGKTEVLPEYDSKKANILEKFTTDKYNLEESSEMLYQKTVNKGYYIDKLAETHNNLQLKYQYDKTLNSFAEAQYVIGVAQTNNKGERIGKSIEEIWKPIEEAGLTKEFSEYILHKHNIDRSEKKKYVFGNGIGPAESTSIVLGYEKKHPEFKKYEKDIKDFNHNNLTNLKEAGMLSQEIIDYIETMYPNYIAISRNLENKLYDKNEQIGPSSALKKATGGNTDIQPLKDTMAQQAIRIKRLINQNELGKELARTLEKSKIEDNVDITLSPSLIMDLDTLVDSDSDGNKIYTYFEDGKLQKLKIDDNLYESLKPTEKNKFDKSVFGKLLQGATNINRSLLTSDNPIFVITNFAKDLQDGMFNSKYSSKFVKNYWKALNEIYTNGKYHESYMANGGMTNTYFDYEQGIKKKSNKFVGKIRNVNEIVEQLPRLTEFISTLEDGKSLTEALYNAAEITTNFKRGGDWSKFLNRNGATFLNASIQGFDKLYRNFSGQNGAKGYINILAKATLLSIVPSILNHMLLDDDEDYKELPQSTKDLYYLFKYDNGKFIRIPKGRALSIFGAAGRRMVEMLQGQEDAWEGYGETIINQIAPNNPLQDNIFAPIGAVMSNKTWYNSDLVSDRLQKELPKNQYDETTDEFSKWLGKQINISPKKINYLVDQYSGGIGDIILPMITPQAKENVFIDKFTTDSVLKNKNVSKFFDTIDKQTQIANDSFSTDEDQLQLKYLNSKLKDVNDLYKEKRNIQMSDIAKNEKKIKVREVQDKINMLAEEALKNYKSVDTREQSASIDKDSYYKDAKGNWTTLTEEEINKNEKISLETYSDFKNKIYSKKQEKIEKGQITRNQDLKDNEKIDILLKSSYTKEEKQAIYENYVKSQKDEQYDILKQSDIDFNEYLKYKQQEFESDKKEDGTVNGKTISGSKRKKEYSYVNDMNITYNQKLLLLGMSYSLTDIEKTKLAKYVNSLHINKDEKLEIYKKLNGFKVYKDGKVTW